MTRIVAVSATRILVAGVGDSEPGPAIALHGAGRPAQRSGSSGRVLVLNASYEPINVCTVRRAAVLILKNRAEILEEGDWALHAENLTLAAARRDPALTYVRIPRDAHRRKITRRAVFARDRWTCQYCGHERGNLTVDHVVPRSKGGASSWENIVTCCAPCNRRKGDRLPEPGEHGAGAQAQGSRFHRVHPRGRPDHPRRVGAVPGDGLMPEATAGEPPRGESTGRVDDNRPPATVDDVRPLRRWLLVAGAWAVAATAIAVIALLAANEDDTASRTSAAHRRPATISQLQREPDQRIDDLERASTTSRRRRTWEISTTASSGWRTTPEAPSDQIDELSPQLDDLDQRVEALEQARPDTTDTEPAPETTAERRGAPRDAPRTCCWTRSASSTATRGTTPVL